MIHDILFSLLGFTGDLIIEKNQTFCIRDNFELLTISEKSLINLVVPLGWFYNYLNNFARDHSVKWSVTVLENEKQYQCYRFAVSAGILDLLSVYSHDVSQLEQTIMREGPMTLTFIQQSLQKYLIVFPVVRQICDEIVNRGIKGCQLLDYLATFPCGIAVIKDVVNRILYHVRVIFVKQCVCWTLYGELNDIGNEFFIKSREITNSTVSQFDVKIDEINLINEKAKVLMNSIRDNSQVQHINDSYSHHQSFDWNSTFILSLDRVPESHVTPRLASKILFCGKAVKLLQLSSINSKFLHDNLIISGYSDVFKYLSGEFLELDETFENEEDAFHYNIEKMKQMSLDELPRNGFHKDDIERLLKKFHSLQINLENSFDNFNSLISDIYDSVSSKLWLLLKRQMKFLQFLNILRNTYLLGRGEMFQCIINEILEQVLSPVTCDRSNSMICQKIIFNSAKLLNLEEKALYSIIEIQAHVSSFKFHCKKIVSDSNQFKLLGVANNSNKQQIGLSGIVMIPSIYKEITKSNNSFMMEQLQSSEFLTSAIVLKERMHIAKGFKASYAMYLDWSGYESTFVADKLNSGEEKENRNVNDHIIGSQSLVLHNHRHGCDAIGLGELGVHGFQNFLAIGVSIIERRSETIMDSSYSYLLRLHICGVNNSPSNSNRETSFRPDESNLDIKGLQTSSSHEIIFEKMISIPRNSEDKASLSLNKPLQLEIEYIKDTSMQSANTNTNANANANISLSTMKVSDSISSISTLTSTIGNLAYWIRIRLVDHKTVEESNASIESSRNTSWDVEYQFDISKHMKLVSGEAYVSIITSSLANRVKIPSPSKTSFVYQDVHCLGMSLESFEINCFGAFSGYPAASSFTSSRYPEASLRLQSIVSKYRSWMNLKMRVNYPEMFRIIVDNESQNCYERLFSMLMKVKFIGNSLEHQWKVKSRMSNDRTYCCLRHSMHFFIKNLIYYLQVSNSI